jgi:hypothetical protein
MHIFCLPQRISPLIKAAVWREQQRTTLLASKDNLIGNMLLAAGAVAYLGPFTQKYRAAMLKTWARAAVVALPVSF